MTSQERHAWVRLGSGGRFDLLHPDPDGRTDEDLAVGLSRTCRWGGISRWALPLPVAQHSLTVLAIRERQAWGTLPPAHALRELLHDADEALLGGFDCPAPLKPHLGEAYARLVEGLRDAISVRYGLPAWRAEDHALHKHADRLAAAVRSVAGDAVATLGDQLSHLLDGTGYRAMVRDSRTEAMEDRLENLQELLTLAGGFHSAQELLDHAALASAAPGEEGTGRVQLMTLHKGKGQEFGHVFLPAWEVGTFPSLYGDPAEERRLAYVALTRGMQRVAITHREFRRGYTGPSGFITDTPMRTGCRAGCARRARRGRGKSPCASWTTSTTPSCSGTSDRPARAGQGKGGAGDTTDVLAPGRAIVRPC